MPDLELHFCEKFPDEPDDVWVIRGEKCPYCGRRAPLRTITPHKGGRTVGFHIRMRPEIKARIDALAAERDCSQADLIEHWTLSVK